MKSKLSIGFLFIFALSICDMAYPFAETYTHPSLSQEGANNSQLGTYLQNQLGYAAGLNTQLHISNTTTPFVQDLIDRGINKNVTTRSILEWLREGSKLEDAKLWQARSQHHFYDPIRNAGLNNRTDYPDWEGACTRFSPFDLRGESALFWVLTGTSSTGYPKNNQETWPATRNKFYSALTSPISSNREQYMAETFIAIGHILHMLEDMGVPAHTRNDFLFGHYRSDYKFDWGNPFEKWAERQIDATANDNIPSAWLIGWKPQAKVYSKLSHYWDTDSDTIPYIGPNPSSTWGLAEQTNYQFLSMSTGFGCFGTLYQFPNPAESHTTLIPELHPENGTYFRYFQGYGLQHLARQTYTSYKAGGYSSYIETLAKKTVTPDYDNNVYNDYIRVTIPRTIDYVTGLTNYFFRGRLSVEPNWADPNTAELTITNDSNNSGVPQVLKGGEFELYWDNTDGNRAEVSDFTVSGWGLSSILDYNNTVTATFTKEANAASYTLVYQGQISENPSEPDTDDPNALAVAVFRPGYGIIAWGGHDNYGQISNVPDGNDFVAVAAGNWHCIALKSDDSLAGWGRNTYNESNVPAGNDYIDISAGHYHSIALKSDGSIVVWGRDNLHQITDKPDGNDFVAIAAGDYHSLAIREDSTIIGWGGYNTYGECDAPPPDAGTVYIDIAAGSTHSLGLQSDGVVKAWGNNNMGQTRIYGGAAGRVHDAVAAGGNYSFLLRDDDVLISWGGGDWESPGIPRYHYRYADGNDFMVIAAGSDHIMALTSDGKAFDWNWPVGTPLFDSFLRAVPDDVVFIDDIDGGYDFSAALRLP